MKTSDLLLSSLNITEDEYSYRGLFILSANDKSINVDLADLESDSKLEEIKGFFGLVEENNDIKRIIMDKVMEKATISSRIVEGKDYNEESPRKHIEKSASSLDMA